MSRLLHYITTAFQNLFFTVVQIYGLFFLDWNAVYIVYLYWVELLFLSAYVIYRFWQLSKLPEGREMLKKYSVVHVKQKHLKEEIVGLFITKSAFLLVYLLLIGVTLVPFDKEDWNDVKTVADFFENILVSDPWFLLAILFIIFYYLRKIIQPVFLSPESMIQFSFHLDPIDPKITSPGIAMLTFPFFFLFFWGPAYLDLERGSQVYVYAIWLLLYRIGIDVYEIFRLHRLMKESH